MVRQAQVDRLAPGRQQRVAVHERLHALEMPHALGRSIPQHELQRAVGPQPPQPCVLRKPARNVLCAVQGARHSAGRQTPKKPACCPCSVLSALQQNHHETLQVSLGKSTALSLSC